MTLLTQASKKHYTAKVELKLQNPGGKPSSIRVLPGEVVTFDGTEGVHLDYLLQSGAVVPTKPKRAKPKDAN